MRSNAHTRARSRWRLVVVFAMKNVGAAEAHAQSIATLKGRVTDASGAIVRGASITVREEEIYDIEDSWGPSGSDARHRFVLHAFCELPFGSHPVLRGWQVAAILQAQSGNPLNIVTSNSSLTGVANTVRPDVTGPIRIIGDVNRWFDTSVFVPVNGFGSLSRNAVVGPRFDTLDMSMSKAIPLTSTIRAQVQAEVFNVLNHPNLGQPARIVGSPNFGVITNTRFPPGDSGSSRQVQLAVKVFF